MKKECHNSLPAWDLSDLYTGIKDDKIEQDLNKVKQLNEDLATKYKEQLSSVSSQDFLKALQLCEELIVLESTLSNFAYLNMVTQMNNKDAMAFYQNISEKLSDYNKLSIFFSLEINQLSSSKIDELLQDKELKKYAPFINHIREIKDYELSEAVEEVFHEKSLTSGSAWVRLYEEHSSRLKYIVDDKEYNDAEICKLLLDKDSSIREKAGKEINRVSKENAPLFGFIYNMIIKDKSISDLKRGFKQPISPKNLRNRVDDETVKALADTVRKNYKRSEE